MIPKTRMSVSEAGGDATLLELQQPVEVRKVERFGEHLGGAELEAFLDRVVAGFSGYRPDRADLDVLVADALQDAQAIEFRQEDIEQEQIGRVLRRSSSASSPSPAVTTENPRRDRNRASRSQMRGSSSTINAHILYPSWRAPTLSCSSPLRNISRTMSQPPTNSPPINTCGIVGHAETSISVER